MVSDSITLTDTPRLEVAAQDALTLTDTASTELLLSDSFLLSDNASLELQVSDEFLLVDVAHRVQGETSIDDVALPHVVSITVQEPSIVREWPIRDQVPVRKQVGKEGRQLVIRGWTDSLSDLETLRGYDDGEKHLLILPTGDSMMIYFSDVTTPQDVDEYGRYPYELQGKEAVD